MMFRKQGLPDTSQMLSPQPMNVCPEGFYLSGVRVRCSVDDDQFFCDINYICLPVEELKKKFLNGPEEARKEAIEALEERLEKTSSEEVQESAEEESESAEFAGFW